MFRLGRPRACNVEAVARPTQPALGRSQSRAMEIGDGLLLFSLGRYLFNSIGKDSAGRRPGSSLQGEPLQLASACNRQAPSFSRWASDVVVVPTSTHNYISV
jgi:hypothetical protein